MRGRSGGWCTGAGRRLLLSLLALSSLRLLLLGVVVAVVVLGHPGVDELGPVLHHLPDQPLRLQLVEGLPRERPAHLHPLGDDGRRDQLVRGHLLKHLVVGGLVKEHQVVQLVPGLALRPLLLLGLAARRALLLLGGLRRRLRRLRVLLSALKREFNTRVRSLITKLGQDESGLIVGINSCTTTQKTPLTIAN